MVVGLAGPLPDGPCPACGLEHRVPIEAVVIGHDARERLGEYLDRRRWRSLLLVSDANTAEAEGDALGAELEAAGHQVGLQRFSQRHGLLADEQAVEAVRAMVATHRPEVLVAVGSGVLNDVTRYASFLEHRPYLSVPTAASMDGYASGVAAMQFNGLKVTLPAQTPLGIFADPAVLAAAPREMLVWGLGDLAGKATAHFDWLLANGVAGESYCPRVAELVLGPLRRLTADVELLLASEEAAVVSLLEGLVSSGLAMAMAGSSRPASGCEHHVSHFLDLLAFRGVREHSPHGLQVGYASRFAAAVQQASISHLGEAMVVAPGSTGDEERRWYGEQAQALATLREEKRRWYAEHAESWPKGEEEVAALGRRLSGASAEFPAVQRALGASGVPATSGLLGVDAKTLRGAFRYANRLRNRFTVLDLLEGQRRLDEVLEAVLPND